jgi:hypothetical protein
MKQSETIVVPKHHFKNFNEARKWAKQHIAGSYINDDTGKELRISHRTIDKYLSGKAVGKSVDRDVHLSILIILPALIQKAVLQEIHADKNENIYITEILRLFGKINYQEQCYWVKITVKVTLYDGNTAYSYEVLDKTNPAIN